MAHYPSLELLAEIGRVNVAAARTDRALSQLWATLDPLQPGSATRTTPVVSLRDHVKREAKARLTDDTLRTKILETVNAIEVAVRRRNNVTHRELVLAGPGPTPTDEQGRVNPLEALRHLEQSSEAAERGEGLWHERPSRSWPLKPPRPEQDDITELGKITRVLEELESDLASITRATACARDLNNPPQWSGPPVKGPRLRATFSLAGLVLTDPATGAQRGTVRLDLGHEQPAPEQNGAYRVHRFLLWFDDLDDGQHGSMTTKHLDQALEHAGWHRVMPWIDDGDSTSTTVAQHDPAARTP
ncbi:MAG: hypothetical protein ACRYF3_11200 [Janthinobacterium lividum]